MSEKQKRDIRNTVLEQIKNGTFVNNSKYISGKKGKEHPMYGHRHTDEAKKKQGDTLRGKSLVDVYGKEKFQKHIETMKLNFSGEANHNYRAITQEQIIDLIKQKKSEKEMLEILKISKWTLYSKLTKLFNCSILSKLRKIYE